MSARQAGFPGAAQPFAEVGPSFLVADHEDDAAGRVQAGAELAAQPEPTTISPASVTAWVLPWM